MKYLNVFATLYTYMQNRIPGVHDFDGLLLKVLLITTVIGIVIAATAGVFFRDYVYGVPHPFTTLAFTEPLPHVVTNGTEYDYGVEIASYENEEKTYAVEYSIELFRIYNETEERYRCMSDIRQKHFVEWSNETVVPLEIPFEHRSEGIPDFFIDPKWRRNITWDQYTVEFKIEKHLGEGIFSFYFANASHVKYVMTINEHNGKIYLNNQEVADNITLEKQNNYVVVKVSGNDVKVYLNEEYIGSFKHMHPTDGQIGFVTRDAFYGIAQLYAYEESKIVVPDRDTIISYDIISRDYQRIFQQVRDTREKSVRLVRAFERYNETIDCSKEPFYCEYFDLPNDISFALDTLNLTRAMEKIPAIDENINYRLFPLNKEQSVINWTTYKIRFSHDQLSEGSKGVMVLKFSDKWAIIITRNNSYYARPVGEEIVIDEFRNPPKKNTTQDFVDVIINERNITFLISNETVFVRITPRDYTNGSLDILVKNVYLFINPVLMTNSEEQCDNPYSVNYCQLTLEIMTRMPEQIEIDENVFTFIETGVRTPTIEQINVSRPVVMDPIPVSISTYNPYIPDNQVVFNTKTTYINSSNYSMTYGYTNLDGSRVNELGFIDENGKRRMAMYSYERRNLTRIYYEGRLYNIRHFTNMSRGHAIGIEVRGDSTMFKYDYRTILHLNGTTPLPGYFYFSNFETYAEIGGAVLQVDDGYKRLQVDQADPCIPRRIYFETVKENITIPAGGSAEIKKRFLADRFFDYGKVSVHLNGSSSENGTLHIHYWVISDDS